MNQRATTQTDPPINLNEAVRQLRSREDFVAFLRAVLQDLRAHPDQWTNNDLPTFLEGMAAWTEDMEGYYQHQGEALPEKPSWQTLGQMLLAARVYE